jgi:hypothetical protein
MFATKFSAIARAMVAALIAAAGAVLFVGPALLGHGVVPWWVSARPSSSQAAVFGPSHCHKVARHHRDDPNYPIPPECVNSVWLQLVSPPPGDAPPPPDDAP